MSVEDRSSGTGRSLGARVAVLITVIGALGAGITLLAGGRGPVPDERPDPEPLVEASSSDETAEVESAAACAARLEAILVAADGFEAAFGAALDRFADLEPTSWAEQADLFERMADELRPSFAALSRLPSPTSGPARSVAADVRSGAFRMIGGLDAMAVGSTLADEERTDAANERTLQAIDDFYEGLSVLDDLGVTGFVDVCPGG